MWYPNHALVMLGMVKQDKSRRSIVFPGSVMISARGPGTLTTNLAVHIMEPEDVH